MSKEKTIKIGDRVYALPFTTDKWVVNDANERQFGSFVIKQNAEAIADALNFQHVKFPSLVAKVQKKINNSIDRSVENDLLHQYTRAEHERAFADGLKEALRILEAKTDARH